MENIGVIDWFTKDSEIIKYPDESDKNLDKLIEEIIECFKKQDLTYVADSIYKTLKNSEFYTKICSDSRLKICSLFHHSKNTSGVAVCLAHQKHQEKDDFKSKALKEYEISDEIYSDDDFYALIRISSLLHDIGKPRSYSSKMKNQKFYYHTTQTKEIIEYILDKAPSEIVLRYELKKILPLLASRHHSRDSKTDLEKLIGSADSVASGADRSYEINANFEKDSVTVQSADKIFPHEINFNDGDLQCMDTPHTEILGYNSEIKKSVKLKKDTKSVLLFKDSVVDDGGILQYIGWTSKNTEKIGVLCLDIMQIQNYINEATKLPMLRGGSLIIEEILEEIYKIISKHVCEEAILFKGGGNLLAFVPCGDSSEDIKNEINKKIKTLSSNGLESAICIKDVELYELSNDFGKVLKEIYKDIEKEKNKTKKEKILLLKKKNVCNFCFSRQKQKGKDKCEVCETKEIAGKEEKYWKKHKDLRNLVEKSKLNIPNSIDEIGKSIAVLVVDGNMMGRVFTQTKTPAEYNYKSEVFDEKFKNIINEIIKEFIENEKTRKLIENNKNNKKFAGIDVIYIGGDDCLIIINSRAVIKFCEMLITKISKEFKFSKKFFNGELFENPTVTISCGIAIADYKFPIYFLLEKAKEMESKAKSVFREKTKTNQWNIIELPNGSFAFTVVNGAMPTDEEFSIVLPNDKEKFDCLEEIITKSLDKNKRSKISELITCGNTELEKLNFIKYLYSSGFRKETEPKEWIQECEWIVKILNNKDLFNSAKALVPHIRRGDL